MKSLLQIYSGSTNRIDQTDLTSYPGGTFKNENPTGANNGTPLERTWAQETWAALQAIVCRFGRTFDGDPETVGDSQFVDGIKAVMSERNTGYPATNKVDLCSGRLGKQWHNPRLAPNYLDVTASCGDLADACLVWRPQTQSPRLMVLSTAGAISSIYGCWDPTSAPTRNAFLPIGVYPSTAEYVCGICSDGDALYIAWRRDSDGHLMVSRQDVEYPLGAIGWTCDTGELASQAANPISRITIADDDNVAVSTPFFNYSGSARLGIVLVDKSSGAVVDKGVGTGTSDICTWLSDGRILSDGDHIFWIRHLVSGDDIVTKIESAKISNPTTSDYSSTTICTHDSTTTSRYHIPSGFAILDDAIVTTSPSGRIYQYSKSGDYAKLVMYAGAFSSYGNADGTYHAPMGFDGMNTWVGTMDAHTTFDAIRIPGGQFGCPVASGTTYPTQTFQGTRICVSANDSGQVAGDNAEQGWFIFDQWDLWWVSRHGHIHRIVNPGMR